MGEANLPLDLIGNLGKIAGGPPCRLLGQILCHLIASHALVGRDTVDGDPILPNHEGILASAAPLAHCWPGPRPSDEMCQITDQELEKITYFLPVSF